MNKKINILFVIESFFDGGAEMFAIRLANSLAFKANITFLELNPDKSKKKEQIKLLNKTEIELIQPKRNLFYRLLGYKFPLSSKLLPYIERVARFLFENKIKKIVKKSKIDIIHSHSWLPDFYFTELYANTDIKIISSLHGHYELFKDKNPNFYSITHKIVNRLDHIVYLSNEHLKTLRSLNVSFSKCSKIFYGLEFVFNGKITDYSGQESLRLCMVARGIPEKGWKETIEAVISINIRNQIKVQLVLVGEGDYLESLAEHYKDTNINFMGYRSNVSDYIKEAHVCLLPTYYTAESLPNSVIEYLSFGKPIITTNIGAIPEMIEANSNYAGFIIDVNEKKLCSEDIEFYIDKYIDNPQLIKQHSAIALEAFKKFDMNVCMNGYYNLYSSLLK